MSKPVYSTKVTATGGRHGSIRSDEGLLDLKLALPQTLGGKGDTTNPEQLFAGGYAACFENVLFHVSCEARHHFAGVDQETAEQLVEGTDAICPYSNAIRANVDVQIAVSVR